MIWSGKPTKTPDEFVRMTEWAKGRPSIRDIYFCTSLQRRAGVNAKGKSKVMRSAADALAVKAIWLDIDVKDPPKGYASLGEAIDELQRLIKMAQLPPPSALIGSGGGLHVYWISDRLLSVEEWRPFAEGLKAAALRYQLRCDAGCTTDVARILRVPNTFNYKTTPPKAVRVLGQLGRDINFETELASIKHVVTATVTVAAPTSFLPGKPDPAFLVNPVEKMGAGVGSVDPTPLDAVPMIKECPFFRDAFKTGGKEHNQPLWNLTVLATTFLEKGEHLAHKLGNQHPGYSRETTDDMYKRKVREQAERDLGWPSCSKFQGEGSKFCAGCKYFGQIKSPLSLAGRTQKVQLAVPQRSAVALAAASHLHLPKGYIVDDDGYVAEVVEIPAKDGGVPETIESRLLTCKVSKPYVQHNPDMLCYMATADLGNLTSVYVPFEAMATSSDLCRALLKSKVTYESKNKGLLEHFHMAWVTKLHNIMKASVPQPMGWYYESGVIRGFCYGGTLMKDDGSEHPSGFTDPVIQAMYAPTGQLQPWMDAANLVTDQKRPEMDALFAVGFGAPLLTLTGQSGSVLSVWGDSGARKSSAVETALGIWGHPKKSKEVPSTTAKSAIGKFGALNNLPLFWDEIKDEKVQEKAHESVYGATMGVGPGRLKTDGKQRDKDTWQTIMSICANRSFVDYVVKREKVTDAGIYRVLEYHVKRAPEDSSTVMSHDAANIIARTYHNYGLMGLKYGKYLSLNHVAITQAMKKLQDELHHECNGTTPERFWFAIMASIIMGAQLGNDMGCNFDVPALRKFLIDVLNKNRVRHKEEAVQGGTAINTEELVTAFIKEFNEHQIWTDTYHIGPGRPRPVQTIWGPNPQHGKAIQIQWVVFERLLRISKRTFTDWAHAQDISPMQVLRGMKDNFNAQTDTYARLASGTPQRGGQEHLIEIPIPPGSDFEAQLLAHCNKSHIDELERQDKIREAEKAAKPDNVIAAAIAKQQEHLGIAMGKTIH